MKNIKILAGTLILSFFFILQTNTNAIFEEKPLNRFERHLKSGMNDNKNPMLDKRLRDIRPDEGFAFLSGNSGSIHNHPTIYLGSGRFCVIGFEFYKVFLN